MTEDEIRNLSAGDEMDTRVAEDVMGWHKGFYISSYENGHTYTSESPSWLDAENRYMHGLSDGEGFEDSEDFHLLHWHPSESILWAWEVVEKCWVHTLKRIRNPSGGVALWMAIIYSENGAGNDVVGVADTAPLAICRAALLMVSE